MGIPGSHGRALRDGDGADPDILKRGVTQESIGVDRSQCGLRRPGIIHVDDNGGQFLAVRKGLSADRLQRSRERNARQIGTGLKRIASDTRQAFRQIELLKARAVEGAPTRTSLAGGEGDALQVRLQRAHVVGEGVAAVRAARLEDQGGEPLGRGTGGEATLGERSAGAGGHVELSALPGVGHAVDRAVINRKVAHVPIRREDELGAVDAVVVAAQHVVVVGRDHSGSQRADVQVQRIVGVAGIVEGVGADAGDRRREGDVAVAVDAGILADAGGRGVQLQVLDPVATAA